MAQKPRNKMPIEARAAQFMPFAALKGFPEALSAKEKISVPRIELPPEAAEELDSKMRELKKGRMATVIYFCKGEYIKTTGLVARIDTTCRLLQIVNTKIDFDDIRDIWLT